MYFAGKTGLGERGAWEARELAADPETWYNVSSASEYTAACQGSRCGSKGALKGVPRTSKGRSSKWWGDEGSSR